MVRWKARQPPWMVSTRLASDKCVFVQEQSLHYWV